MTDEPMVEPLTEHCTFPECGFDLALLRQNLAIGAFDGPTPADKAFVHVSAHLLATIDALLSQLREQRELLRVNQDAHKKCDVLMAELGRQLTAAERTVREQREALAVLGRIASYDPRWVGMHVNDAPGRAKIIAMAYDAIAALAPNTEGEGT